MIKSIRLKLTLWYIGSISLLLLISGVIVFLRLQAFLVKDIDTTLYNGGQVLGNILTEYKPRDKGGPKSLHAQDSEGEEYFVDELDHESQEIFFVNVAFIQLITCPENPDGFSEVVTKTANLRDKYLPFSKITYERIEQDLSYAETIKDFFPFPIRLMNIKVYDFNKNPYILQIAFSFQKVQNTLKNLMLTAFLLAPVLLIILSILGFLFMKRAFSPVKKILALTKSITAEDLSQRLDPVDSDDEIGELAETLNSMIARLESSFAHIKQFSEDVAHELKTPLAKLKCNAEVSLRRQRTKNEYQSVIISLIEDTKVLEQITNDLLFLSRMDSQSIPQSFERLLLNEVFLKVFEETHVLARKANLIFEFDRIDPVEIEADEGLVKRMLINLISNAVKYTHPKGKVRFDLQKQGDKAVFTITDTGIGICEDDLPFIFDRFYRVDPSRSLETGGSGLGLAIVQKIVKFHDGEISVKSSLGKGTAFSIYLPCVK
jgi:heavy metal sensor kinase